MHMVYLAASLLQAPNTIYINQTSTSDGRIYLWIAIAVALIALALAFLLAQAVISADSGTAEMQLISNAIREGAEAFLKRQYQTIGIIALVLAVIVFIGYHASDRTAPYAAKTVISFLVGAICSGLAGFTGMYCSIRANIRAASAARTSLDRALKMALRGGAVTGLVVVALSLLGVSALFLLFGGLDHPQAVPFQLVGFGFGASLVALFAQLGGGIYTKAADVGADLVGKVEAGIPEDDPRNPAVIADLVGDNVGDCAGRGADIFESTAAENVGAMILGAALYPVFGLKGILFPLIVLAINLIASIVGVFVVKTNDTEDPMRALNRGFYVTSFLALLGFAAAVYGMLNGNGVATHLAALLRRRRPGHRLPLRLDHAVLHRKPSTAPSSPSSKPPSPAPRPTSSAASPLAWKPPPCPSSSSPPPCSATTSASRASPESPSSATLPRASTAPPSPPWACSPAPPTSSPWTPSAPSPTTPEASSRCPTSPSPSATAPTSSTQPETPPRPSPRAMPSAPPRSPPSSSSPPTSKRSSPSSPTSSTYAHAAGLTVSMPAGWSFTNINLAEIPVFVGALLGAMLTYLFSSLAIKAVGRTAQMVVKDVRDQFRENPGIMAGTSKPDYARCVSIVTGAALKEMVLPGLPRRRPARPRRLHLQATSARPTEQANASIDSVGAALVPTISGLPVNLAGAEAVAGLLMVGTISGVLLAMLMNNGGGAWDNAKKYIETGQYGGKKSDAHKAAVVGDTVGDPFKDTAGPSLHVLIKLLATITLVLAPLFV